MNEEIYKNLLEVLIEQINLLRSEIEYIKKLQKKISVSCNTADANEQKK